ncbi:MAG: Flp pilus assembly complex ATPase component TadA [Solirubrobacterales bacterium]|nr:Flp pilus assembly complex ATPase component TadA [Solirubrobacterales bacterium]
MSSAPPAASPAEAPSGFTPPSRRGGQPRRIGDAIVELGFASREAVERAVELARATGQTTGQALLEADVVTADQHARAVAERFGVDHVDLGIAAIDPAAIALVQPTVLRRHRAVPIGFADGGRALVVATVDPGNVLAFDDLAVMTGLEIRRAVTSAADLELLLARLSRLDADVEATDAAEEEEHDPRAVAVDTDEAPVVKLVHSIVADAVGRGASDIHFDPRDGAMRVRMRVDGVVGDTATVPRAMVAGLVSRVKIMANLDIAERRRPQDGRIGLTVDGRAVDIRVATLPTVDGEAVVMRVLDKSGGALALERLGLAAGDLERLRAALARLDGCVLATGPTGSGKTTTLYAALTEINDPSRTLITIEDPVEYELDGVKQIQVNPRIGLDFAAGLRSMMRSDPDVMMVGEIRDSETARIAIQSALTGHLVLSTLHTTGAPHSVARLVDMGIEPFLVASGVSMVVAQRLARRLCDCAAETTVSADDLRRNGFADAAADIPARAPVGCPRCGQSGYRGRVGLYELMEVTDPIRDRIVAKRSADAIAAIAVEQGMRRLRDDGLDKVAAGVTSLAEVLRVAGGAARAI